MVDRNRQIIKFAARLLVGVALLVWIFSRVDLDQFWDTVQTAQWRYLIGVWAFTAVFLWVQAMVMQRVLKKQGCDVSLTGLFGASCATALYSLALPGILSTGVKWYILKRHTGRGSHVLSSMLYNQVMLSTTMAAIGLVGLAVTNPTRVLLPNAARQWVLPAVCAAVLGGIVLMLVLLLNGRTGGAMSRCLALPLRLLPRSLREKGQAILAQLAVFQTAGLRFHLTIVGINLVDGFLLGLLIYLSAAKAANVTVGLGVLVWLCAIVYVLGKLPISVANLGVREVTMIGFLSAYGVAEPAALLMSMALFSAVLFMAALGAVYQLFWAVKGRPPENTIV